MKKNLAMALLVFVAGGALAAAPTQAPVSQKQSSNKGTALLSGARARIDAAIKDPAVMKELMKKLSAAEQKQFLAEVNKAIANMPGSVEQKAAAFLNANLAAITSAAPGNSAAIIAEAFATVPPEMLTGLVENLATGSLSRKSVSGAAYSDAQFEKIATDLMQKISTRCAETDNPSPRDALAAVMLIDAFKSSATEPSEDAVNALTDKLIEILPSQEARELAKKEWFPAAFAQRSGQERFEPILASADFKRRPDFDFVLVIMGPQFHDSVLPDLFSRSVDAAATISTRTPILDAVENPLKRQYVDIEGDVVGTAKIGGIDPDLHRGGDVPTGTPGRPGPEPSPYQWQR